MEAQDLQPKQGKYNKLQEQVSPELREKWELEQKKIQKLIIDKDSFNWTIQNLKLIAGVDLSADKQNTDIACVGLVVWDTETQNIVYQDYQIIQINQPYIPGFLAFRQIPPLYSMFKKLKDKQPHNWPQLILVDGNGILHPNQCGLASHLGVLLDTPAVGVGKTLFYIDGLDKNKVKQQCKKQIKKAGDYSILIGDSGRYWGAGLRVTEESINPVFVSIGHKISLETAIKSVLKASIYRVPEPIRLADKKSRQLIQKQKNTKKTIKFEMIYLQNN